MHLQLRRLWLNRHGLFAELSSAEQWRLHDYFRPNHEMTGAELLVHRADISKQRRYLPQGAGKAYAKLIRAAAAWSAQLVTTSHRAARVGGRCVQYIRVRSVVRPGIDAHALARAIIEMARADLAARIVAEERGRAGE